ncbi:hypothetical protein BUALT_Bualt04G0174800 [Buddleja alternifolia]|uniref:Uncharacterized protein n=1 Tax=Buddleja alternifolia TaxID=168488 RepID=A0AAV6XXV5_9LAMI|nr:hypothetical protein BUALT_Bualt04G0174800 [Buddleja alternifolia]
MREEDEQTRVLYELCSMIIHIFRSPPLPISFPTLSSQPSSSSSPPSQISPAAFGSLFIGISVALMLFGSVTFLIGFILMPLVIMLVMLFYFVGIVSNLSEIGRSILWPGYDSYKVAPVKMIVCTNMDKPLVRMFVNSIALLFPGSWNSSPGDNNTNNITAIRTGAKSAIFEL